MSNNKEEFDLVLNELFKYVVKEIKGDISKLLRFNYENQLKFFIAFVNEFPDDEEFAITVLHTLVEIHGAKVLKDLLDLTDKLEKK